MLKQVHCTTSRRTEKIVANTTSEDCRTKPIVCQQSKCSGPANCIRGVSMTEHTEDVPIGVSTAYQGLDTCGSPDTSIHTCTWNVFPGCLDSIPISSLFHKSKQ